MRKTIIMSASLLALSFATGALAQTSPGGTIGSQPMGSGDAATTGSAGETAMPTSHRRRHARHHRRHHSRHHATQSSPAPQ